MGDFIHYDLRLGSADGVRVVLRGCSSDVFLVDDANFHAFRAGRGYRYFGGHATESPVALRPPHAGRWHLVVLPAGGRVEASVSVDRAA